jgi:hypothetical protein
MATWLFFLLCSAVLIIAVIERLRDGRLGKYASDADLVDWVRIRCRFLHPVVDEIPVTVGSCAYCQNRAQIYIRVRDAAGQPFDKEDLLFVFVHELAHVLADEEPDAHGPQFQLTFERLKERAVAAGLFPADHVVPPSYVQHCPHQED